jgi:hypothetical protein
MYKIRKKKEAKLREVIIYSDFPFLPDLEKRIERELGERIILKIIRTPEGEISPDRIIGDS